MTGNTRVSILGTLAEFHQEPIPYDIQALIDLVVDIHPDLLCLDMTLEAWQQQELRSLPPEYREALLPLAYQTDIVIVPIGSDDSPDTVQQSGWRGMVINWLRAGLAAIQRRSSGPDAINHGWRHELSNLLYHLSVSLMGGNVAQQRKQHTARLSRRTLEVARQNPGSRILVVVNIQYCHHIRPILKRAPDIQEMNYIDL